MIVSIDKLKMGDILDQDVVMPSGRVLMTVGMQLTESMIELIKKREFVEIHIKDDVVIESSPVVSIFTEDVLVNDAMKAFKEYIVNRPDYYEMIVS